MNEIQEEYRNVESILRNNGQALVNTYELEGHNLLEINKENAEIVGYENLKNISQSDCVIVNLSIPNHLYVGCIGEMVCAKIKGCFVITVVGDSSASKRMWTLLNSDIVVKTLDEACDFIKGEIINAQ